MTTAYSGRSLLIVPYEWTLENVEKDFKTIVTNLILFRGEKVFRVALKNSDKPSGLMTLLFLGINLNKMGLKISGVVYGKQGVDTHCKMNEQKPLKMSVESSSYEENLQLFTRNVPATSIVDGKCTFIFKIQLDGIVADYSYNPCDLLAKEQFWAVVNDKLYADVEFIVKDKRFSAHKAILAARSPVFRAKFTQKLKNENPHQIRIDDVDASSFEQFLYFVYTGESKTQLLAIEHLLKLAERYQLKTLGNLCRIALVDVNADQMINLVNLTREETSSKISPEMDTEVYADNRISTLECYWTFRGEEARTATALGEYRNERMFFVQLDGQTVNWTPEVRKYQNPLIRFFFVKPRNCDFKIVEITMAHGSGVNWIQMKPGQENNDVNTFTARMDSIVGYTNGDSIVFRVKIVNTVENYCFSLADTNWGYDLWSETQLTDVNILVGSYKFPVHRVVLCARSPVMKALFGKINKPGKSIWAWKDVNVLVVKHFLIYLYTGSLEISAKNKQLLALAETYQVSTLKETCQFAFRVSHVEEISSSLLALI